MKRMDDLIQAVTYRFGPDAELQREIARELRAHLEDAVAAARAGGMDEAHAEETAVRAFGDPEEIAEKLWHANRRRMRLRAMAKWTGRLVLMPAGILLAVWLCAVMMELVGVLQLAFQLHADWAYDAYFWALVPNKLRNDLHPGVAARNNLKEDERLLLEANLYDEGPYRRVEKWEKLVRLHPDNPVYRARQYAALLSSIRASDAVPLAPSDKKFAQAQAILDAGERADPDNAFWNYMKADLLMYKSGAAKQEEDPSFTFARAARGKEPTTGHGMRLIFADRAMFERGLDEYRKGLTKPFYKSYAVELNEELLALRKSPTTLLDELCLVEEWAGTLLPDLAPMRNMSRGVMAYAALLIKEGHPREAEALIRTAPIASEQVGATSRLLIELLVAYAMRQTALRQGAALYERLGKRDLAAQALARKESQQEGSFLQRMDPSGEEFKFLAARAGFFGSHLLESVPLADRSIITDLQRAERFLAERAALGCLALLYLIVVGWLGIGTLWSLWRHRKDAGGPKLYFIGWRRLGWIALIAVALPLTAYVILTRAFAAGSAHYGINYQPGRVALEMGGVALLVFGLSLFLAWRAAKLSCGAAGINDRAEFRMSVRRSLLPILVACFLLVGIVSQAYLRYGESSAVKALSQPGRRPFLDEMNYVAWKDYKDYLRALPDHGALPADAIRR
jgi:hypothetical protein